VSPRHTPATAAYPRPLHDALPILLLRCAAGRVARRAVRLRLADDLVGRMQALVRVGELGTAVARRALGYAVEQRLAACRRVRIEDRKSTRLNSSHVKISYAVFCLK